MGIVCQDHIPAHFEGGHKENSLLRHLLDRRRVLIQERSMLDRTHTSLNGFPNPIGAVGVCGHPPAEFRGFFHKRADFVLVEVSPARLAVFYYSS